MADLDSFKVNNETYYSEQRWHLMNDCPMTSCVTLSFCVLVHMEEYVPLVMGPSPSVGELWRNVHIADLSDWKLVKIAEAWLKRAGKFPVSLEARVYQPDEANADHIAMFKRLCSCARITCLDLEITIDRLRDLPDDILQDVEEIRLRTALCEMADAELPRLPSFMRHTRFFRCVGHAFESSLDVSKSALPWSQILYLDLHCLQVSVSQCLSFLRHMVSLEECRLPIIELGCDSMAADQQGEFTLPQLRTFVLNPEGHGAAEALNGLARSITTPRLRRFAIRGTIILGAEATAALVARLNFCQLEEIELHRVWTGDIPLGTLLPGAPALRRITFPPCNVLDGEIISELATGRLGSCLEYLEIPSTNDPQRIFKMVESRQRKAKFAKKGNGSQCSEAYGNKLKITPLKEFWVTAAGSPKRHARRIARLNAMGVTVVMNDHRFPRTASLDNDASEEPNEFLVEDHYTEWESLEYKFHIKVWE
ncbi:hypothetical protein AX17_006460 [Amanita inopinata Kibby_2008]|nr:hypothetical protein AX17_006460 [Amanita inopinata Kibby_2008]